MVNFPSLLLSIFAHVLVFLILLFSVQFKTNNESLNGYVINFAFTEYMHIEEIKTEKTTNENLFESKNFYKKKVTLNKIVNSETSKVVDDFQIKKKTPYIQKKVIPKEKKIFKTKVIPKEKKILKIKVIPKEKKIFKIEAMPKEKKIFKFQDKKIEVQSFEKKPLLQSNSLGQRMSKFTFNVRTNNYNLQQYKDKKSQYKSVRSCRYTQKVKSKNNPENSQIKIINNKEITISELLGNNYFNPKLININHLLKTPQTQYEHQTSITNLLAKKKQNIIICN